MKATRQPTPTPDTDPAMTPAELLRGAALYLQHRGWTRHQFYVIGGDSGPFPPACAVGALHAAAYGNTRLYIYDQSAKPGDAARAAGRFFAAYLDPEYDTAETTYIDVIGDWNDFDGRTVAEVIETLADAATEWDTIYHTGGAR